MVYHRILLYFGAKKHFSAKISLFPRFSVLSKLFSDYCVLIVFTDWYHSCSYIDYVSSFISYNFKGLSVIYTAFAMNFTRTESFFSTSVSELNLKPRHCQYSRILRYIRIREELKSIYQRVADSEKKTKSALRRTMPQI